MVDFRARVKAVHINLDPASLHYQGVYESTTVKATRTVKKQKVSISKQTKNQTTTATTATFLHVRHAFLYISLLSLHDYDVKRPRLRQRSNGTG